MSRTSKPQVWMAVGLALAVFMVLPPEAGAISTIVPGGGPLAQTTVDIVFGGEPAKAKTDDKGFLPLILQGGDTAKIQVVDDRITLVGDGKGLVTWDGGRVAFEVRDGALSIPNDKGGPLGLGTPGYVGGGFLGAAALVTVGNILGGGESDTINPSTPGTNTTTNTPQSTSPNGLHILTWDKTDDIRGSGDFVGLHNSRQAEITVTGGTFVMIAQPPVPMMQGASVEVAAASGAAARVTARGSGPLAGRPNVLVTLEGALNAGTLNAIVVVGADGSLGPPLPHEIHYRVVGVKQP
jgi:hypothetical protein